MVVASRELLADLADDRSIEQATNVATLPGIVGASFASSCGVRPPGSPFLHHRVAERLPGLLDRLGAPIPGAMGPGAVWRVSGGELREELVGGARHAVEQGHGVTVSAGGGIGADHSVRPGFTARSPARWLGSSATTEGNACASW